MMTHTFAQIVA